MEMREVNVNVSGGVKDLLRDALVSQTFADVSLCCSGGKKFLAHRLVLSAASPYLHEVLSAHGKIAGQCEPITMILAEVEGNDLAAILGFLYTGSVAVPQARLEAFSSTADALKIRIPPLPHALKAQTSSDVNNSRYKSLALTHEDVTQNTEQVGLNLKIINKTNCLRRLLMSSNKDNILEKNSNNTYSKLKSYVANRVIASPWCQFVQPYHLPKIQPILKNNESSSRSCNDIPSSFFSSDGYESSHIHHEPTSSLSTTTTTTVGVEKLFVTSVISSQDTETYNPFKLENTISIQDHKSHVNDIIDKKITHDETINLSSAVFITEDNNQSNYHDNKSDKVSLNSLNRRINLDETDKSKSGTVALSNDSNNNFSNVISTSVVSEVISTITSGDFKCKNCEKIFVCESTLKIHRKSHFKEKPFRCVDCGKEFSQLRNYKYHRSVHEGTGEFAATCPECGKLFNDRSYLGSHMKIHRNKKEYACNDCGKSFNQRVAYNMHVRIHTGVKPHNCDQCGKAFSRKMLLKQHMRTHSGERPYQCHICNKAFADKSNMTLHTRLHSGLKPYQCDICSKAFTKKHHLKTHLNYHTGTKPYACPNCKLTFSQSSNMRTHYKKCLNNSTSSISARKKNNSTVIKKKNFNKHIDDFSNALTPPHSDLEYQTIIRDIS
ncbi:zinc finger protein 415 [Microplitis demolitor]|uniref:zinc finger protein 415 n=1 Tax=Microplitis demolitor TaxID=69319 RepID=UPI0004CD0D2E|nr:zinc finger protein 415 [Microplitis demolitor]